MQPRSRNSPPAEADRSIPDLLQKLASETTLLVRQELRLARAEVMEAVADAKPAAVSFGLCAAMALGAFGALTALLIVALALVIPLWAAALIVTVAYGAAASAAASRGVASLKRLRRDVPDQTVRTIKDDVVAVRRSMQRGR